MCKEIQELLEMLLSEEKGKILMYHRDELNRCIMLVKDPYTSTIIYRIEQNPAMSLIKRGLLKFYDCEKEQKCYKTEKEIYDIIQDYYNEAESHISENYTALYELNEMLEKENIQFRFKNYHFSGGEIEIINYEEKRVYRFSQNRRDLNHPKLLVVRSRDYDNALLTAKEAFDYILECFKES